MAAHGIGRYAFIATAIGLMTLAPAWGAQAGKSPLKGFVLAGQSNMEGQGIISGEKKGTLESLLKDPASAERYNTSSARTGNGSCVTMSGSHTAGKAA
ncbi:MAG: hypothetical protein NTW87_10480 [Planctomycetota bacterium]|nr:hypothetical protein [Planctomycetota bacterium]